MINNITQVSPGNRVDFSKIRKAQEGLKIPKFQTPAGGIGNRKNTYITQDEWWNAHNQANIAQWLKIAQEHPEMTLEELNNFIAQNHNLYTTIGYNGNRAIKGEGVNQYQQDYHNKYGFGNTDAFWNGWENAYSGKSLNTGDLRAAEGQTFTGDNYFGEQTNRRLANYFNDSELAQANEAVKSRGWRWELADYNDQDNRSGIGGRKFYKLVQGDDPGTDMTYTNNKGDGGNGGGGNTTVRKTYTPTEYIPAFQWKPQPFTSPIPNGIIAGLNLAANRHWLTNEYQKKVPLLEAPYHQYITGAYKGVVDAYNTAGANIQSRANQIASQTSNLEQNQATQLQGAEMAENKRLEGALQQQEGYNRDRMKALEVANGNIDSATAVANQNRSNLVADWNRRLDAKSKYQLQRNAIWADNTLKNWTDYGHWKANEENERDAALSSYNDYVAQKDLQNFRKPYEDFINNPYSSNTFNQLYNEANQYFEDNRNSTAWNKNDPYFFLDSIFGNDGSEEDKKNAFLTYLRSNTDSDYGKRYASGYESEKTDLYNQYITNANNVQNQLASLKPSFRNTYTFEGFWNPKALGKQYQSMTYKRGGILKMKARSRFVNYLEHNRKALKDHNQITMENAKLAQKTLQAQLASIDRETLILLRSIFK